VKMLFIGCSVCSAHRNYKNELLHKLEKLKERKSNYFNARLWCIMSIIMMLLDFDPAFVLAL
jgi:hypothetical protein